MSIIRRITCVPFRFGGVTHSGWLPPGAATPLPTPVKEVLLDIEIEEVSGGYLLCYCSHDGSEAGDTWHQSLAAAEETAARDFGVKPADWQVS
jgi:hypothetical protein